MSQKEIQESLDLLEKDWDFDPILRKFVLGQITDVSDYAIKVKDVVFHVPFLNSTYFQQIATKITNAKVWPKSVALIFIFYLSSEH